MLHCQNTDQKQGSKSRVGLRFGRLPALADHLIQPALEGIIFNIEHIDPNLSRLIRLWHLPLKVVDQLPEPHIRVLHPDLPKFAQNCINPSGVSP